MTNDEMKRIGSRCRDYRLNVLGLKQSDVADEIGYSKESVSAFENGRNNNAVILMYYINHGLDLERI